jgi:VWFA-related protein
MVRTRCPSFALVPLAALLVASTAPGAQQDGGRPPGWDDDAQSVPGRQGPITFRTGVQLVLQDITVTDADGHPVTGLKPEDFHIFEDGKPQAIRNFEEHAPIDPALAEQRQAELASKLPPNTFTNYKPLRSDHLVVFLLNMPMGGCPHLSEGLMAYMKTVPAGTPFIVLWLDGSLRMVQDMTTDRTALVATAFQNSKHVDAGPLLAPEDPRYPGWPAALKRRQIVTVAMMELKQYLGAIPGKKDLVWFTDGLGGLSVIDPASEEPAPTHPSVDPRTLHLTYTDPSRNMDLFDPRTTPPPKETKTKKQPALGAYLQDIRTSLAQSRIALAIYQSGCDVFANVQDQIAAIVDRGSHYYVLSYTPTNQNWNGQPRKFSVEMADPTLHLEYRRSYAASPNDTTVQRVAAPVEAAAAAALLHDAAGPSITMQIAMGMGTVEPTQVVFEASATPAPAETKDPGNQPAAPGNYLNVKLRKQGYRDFVVHFRVHANELRLTPSADQPTYTGKLEFVAVVYDNLGQAVNGKREKASVSFPNLTDPQLQAADLTGDLTIQVPAKGSYFLRLGVHDLATDRVGALEIPVDRIPMPGR